MELGSQRKNEKIQHVKEKAAAANQNVKSVTDRKLANLKTPEKENNSVEFHIKNELSAPLTKDFQKCRKKLKKNRSKIRSDIEASGFTYPISNFNSFKNEKFQLVLNCALRRLDVFVGEDRNRSSNMLVQDCLKIMEILENASLDVFRYY